MRRPPNGVFCVVNEKWIDPDFDVSIQKMGDWGER